MHMYREQVEDLQKEIQKIEADYRRQVVTVITAVITLVLKKKHFIEVKLCYIIVCSKA